MAVQGKLMILAGAPLSSQLEGEDQARWLINFETPIKRFLEGSVKEFHSEEVDPSIPVPKWRVVTTQPVRCMQSESGMRTPFLERNINHNEKEDEMFLEHSIAALEDVVAGDLLDYDPSTLETSLTSNPSLASLDDSDLSDTDWAMRKGLHFPAGEFSNIKITNLNEIPDAGHLVRILPQTMTVNMVVAVIAVQPLRTVRLRHRHIDMEIIEVMVGDETRAGFGISFWLTPQQKLHQSKGELDKIGLLRQRLGQMRVGDVVGLRYLALSEFRRCVYGQSLSRPAANIHTAIIHLDGQEVGLAPPLFAKYQAVRAWADNFVGVRMPPMKHNIIHTGQEQSRKRWRRSESLPPDTQPPK